MSGNFNGDDFDDLFWRGADGTINDWLSTGFDFDDNAVNALNHVGIDWQIAGFGDFNGDGRDDILWRNIDGRMTNWLATAAGTFSDNAANAYTHVSPDWHVAAVGDFNGDGRDDILWRNDDGRLTDWLGTASGGFSDNVANAYNNVSTDWQIAGAGDFNGDGRDDILWRNADGRMSDWLGVASGGFVDNATNAYDNVATDWHVAGIGDFNGDRRDDILWENSSNPNALRTTNWLGTETGGFADNVANAYVASIGFRVADVGDFNGDGRDDVVWTVDLLGTQSGRFEVVPSRPDGGYEWLHLEFLGFYDVLGQWALQGQASLV